MSAELNATMDSKFDELGQIFQNKLIGINSKIVELEKGQDSRKHDEILLELQSEAVSLEEESKQQLEAIRQLLNSQRENERKTNELSQRLETVEIQIGVGFLSMREFIAEQLADQTRLNQAHYAEQSGFYRDQVAGSARQNRSSQRNRSQRREPQTSRSTTEASGTENTLERGNAGTTTKPGITNKNPPFLTGMPSKQANTVSTGHITKTPSVGNATKQGTSINQKPQGAPANQGSKGTRQSPGKSILI